MPLLCWKAGILKSNILITSFSWSGFGPFTCKVGRLETWTHLSDVHILIACSVLLWLSRLVERLFAGGCSDKKNSLFNSVISVRKPGLLRWKFYGWTHFSIRAQVIPPRHFSSLHFSSTIFPRDIPPPNSQWIFRNYRFATFSFINFTLFRCFLLFLYFLIIIPVL